ncbi:MAG: hypothetical protein EBT51_12245 [Flavobacteriaceae bacterium]|nr:hypothetical protein [Flavobacteriaceae bacterium]
MIARTNVEDRLKKHRSREISESDLLAEIKNIFDQGDRKDASIISQLQSSSGRDHNALDLDLLDTDRIFHVNHIKAICIDYRLRFLDSKLFKGSVPYEAAIKIKELEKEHKTVIEGFKIMAPSKLFKLENADDPLLFAPIGNGYYYLIHKWGNDLSPYRKLAVLPFKSFENLMILTALVSFFASFLVPKGLLSIETSGVQFLLTFLFMFKSVAAVVLYYSFAAGKNFNSVIWDSKYSNA